MTISIIGKTDIGKERDQNEDAFIICPDLYHPNWELNEAHVDFGPYGTLLVVADGMGGANAGEVASSLAIETIKNCFSDPEITSVVTDEAHIKSFLETSVNAADEALKHHITRNPETIGMGTTIVLCWIIKDKAYIAWCGDSRCYVFNPRTGLKTLTKDHSYVQELIDKGELTEEKALTHPDSNLITRGLGDFESTAKADTLIHPIQLNDIFLLCSDGLCGYCSNHSIEKVFKENYHNIRKCCDKLMELALEAGGYDNICIAMASVEDETKTQPITQRLKCFFKTLFSGK